MKGKKMLAQAITLGLLLAAPCGAMANAIGTVTVDGQVITVNPENKFSIGETNSIVDISSQTGPAVTLLNSTDEGTITGKEITINSTNSRGLQVVQGSSLNLGGTNTERIDINAGGDMGIFVWKKGSKLNIETKELNVNSNGTFGIHVQNNTEDVNAPENAASININADNITVNSTALGLSAFSNGQMNINGNLTVNAVNAIDVRGNSTMNINTDGKHTTVLNGDIVFETPNTPENAQNSGKIINANVNVNLNGEGSSWTGKAYQEYSNGTSVEMEATDYYGNVTGFKMDIQNGAQWNMTGDSFINTVNVADGGVINVQKEVTKFNAGSVALNDGTVNLQGTNQVVNANKVAGSGTITTTDTTNQMTIGEKAADTSLTIKGVGEKLNADALAKDSELAQKLAGTVVTKDKQQNVITAADEVKAEAGIIKGEYSAEVDAEGNVSGGTFAVNENNQAVSNMASIALMAWRAENNDMNKRLGELRNSTGEHGVWARMMRGESKYGEQNVKNQYNTYQLGYDEKLSTDDHWTVGAAISYTDGQSSFANGSGENKHTGLSLYGSYLGDDGSFVDLIAKYARLKHDFDVNGGIGSGDYDTNGYSVSAEYGKRFTKDNGFWLEPQVELTYGKVGSVNYMTDNDASVRQDGMDSLVGRLGFAAGKNIKNGNVYLRASYLYDFDGETSVTMAKDGASTAFEQDLGGGWWEVGVGTNLMLSKATHLYFDVEKTYGGNVATPWQWNAGMRWSF